MPASQPDPRPETTLQSPSEAARIETALHEAAFHHRAGNFSTAEGLYLEVLEQTPENADALHLLGYLAYQQNRDAEAAALFTRANAQAPNRAIVHANLGNVRLRLGQLDEAVECFRTAIRLEPDAGLYWSGLAECFAQGWFDPSDPTIAGELATCLERGNVEPRRLRLAVNAAIRRADQPPSFDDPLLRAFTAREVLANPAVEAAFAAARRDRLLGGNDASPEALVALAQQGFLTEYAGPESSEETARVEMLGQDVARALDTGEPVGAHDVALLAAYRHLARLPFAEALMRRNLAADCPWLAPILARQLDAPFAEQAVTVEIPTLTPIADCLSRAVQAQYEENPYPRWEQPGTLERVSVATVMTSLFPALSQTDIVWPESPKILIAGCGTGRQAIQTAQRYTDSQVLGIDLSRASLAYASVKARELGVANIDFAQADILELADCGRRFDIIESGGVLHHMEAPLDGWRVLTGLLNDGGLMRIALYSDHARRPIAATRAFIEEQGYPSTPDGIRRCRQDILALPDDHMIRQVAESPDFYNLSSCRDLIFHVNEHHLTLPQIESMLSELGLEFVGFEMHKPAVFAAYRNRFPQDMGARNLANWHQFESDNPTTFAGMYQFWARKPDARADGGERPVLPPESFQRVDEEADEAFYREGRLVTHIDDPAIAAVTQIYRDKLPAGGAILDPMSSWVSHLPDDVEYRRVVGLGLNQEELDANPRLDEARCQNLNAEPRLPYDDGQFDGAAICVSIQYLTSPAEVLRDLGRVVKPGGPLVVTYSNRCFATKAVAIWLALNDKGHAELVEHYLADAGNWTAIEWLDNSPNPGSTDPLYAVVATSEGPIG